MEELGIVPIRFMDEPIFNKKLERKFKMEMVVMFTVLSSMMAVSLALPMMLKRVAVGAKK